MIAKQEVWKYPEKVKVWAGKYKHSHNLIHWHYDCEFLYVEKGSIDIFCDKKTHRLSAGDALYVDSEQIHYMSAREPETTLIVIVFDYNILKPYMGEVHLASPQLLHRYDIPTVYLELREALIRKEPFYGAVAASKVIALMAEVFRLEKLVPRAAADKTAQRFIDLLEDVVEKCDSYTFEDAVSFMGMSSAYFSRYFRATTGITFSRYLNYVRVERAVKLLKSGSELSMTEISIQCGFGTIRNFNRIFREFTGYSPKNLPEHFTLSENYFYPSQDSFNPTLYDCELIESSAES